jgi:type VI secretion system ImpJ/VasE family protein
MTQASAQVGMMHWHEGLFLQPHHLQSMQREVMEQASRERRLAWAYPYGVVECRLSTDALENMLVRVDRLRAVMPSGLEIDAPGNTDIPALDIKRVFQSTSGSFTVSLAVPLWHASRGNTVEVSPSSGGSAVRRAVAEETRVKRLFRVAEVTRPDENTGENPQPLLVRKYNARLVVDGDDTQDMEVLPLLRIMSAAEEQTLPRQDPDFVPPCMVLGGSPTLRNRVRDLASAVEAARKECVDSLTRGGWVIENLRPTQILGLLRLQALNRYAARLPSMVTGGVAGPGALHTFDAYLELRSLLGELAALTPDRDPFDAPKYDHDSPSVVFAELDRRIRPLLRGETRGSFEKVPFVRDGANLVLGAALTEAQLGNVNGLYLGIRTKMDHAALARLVENQSNFKLMPKSLLRTNIYGVKLKEDRVPPYEFPAGADLRYFQLLPGDADTNKTVWKQIDSEKAMAIKWAETEAFDFVEVNLFVRTTA